MLRRFKVVQRFEGLSRSPSVNRSLPGIVVIAFGIVLLSAQQATAFQLISSLSGPRQETPENVLTLSPQDAPRPILKYRLLPKFVDQRPGNATVWYGKVKAEQNALFSNQEIWERIYAAIDTPISEMNQYDDLDWMTQDNSIFKFLEYGARCETCDWQLPIRDEPFFSILLPEIQESRQFGRLLTVRARLQISKGDFDGAIRTIQTGLALARHVAASPTLVSGLVGNAIANMMLDQLTALIQQPGAPNLYWALTALPDPVVGVDAGIESELYSLYFTIPGLEDIGSLKHSGGYWDEQYDKLWEQFRLLSQWNDASDITQLLDLEISGSLFAVRGYPIAKQVLLAEGVDPEILDKMSVTQTVLYAALVQYEVQRDDTFRRFFMTYPEAQRLAGYSKERKKELLQGHPEVIPLADFLLPAIDSVHAASTRHRRNFAVLRVVEAIRLYAAANGGKFPESLAAITDIPLPNDPVTEQPFWYETDGEMAKISGPELPGAPLQLKLRWKD